jgi:drug/metabolite transporter (DMT)-like permease
VTGALWAAASGIGFGLFQSINRLAVRDMDAYLSTFLQVAVAFVVLAAVALPTQDLGQFADASTWSLVAFALAGLVHFLAGWTFLNLSQKRIGAARTAPLLTFSPLFGLPVAAVAVGDLPSAPALAAIVPMVAGAWLLAGGRGGQVGQTPAAKALAPASKSDNPLNAVWSAVSSGSSAGPGFVWILIVLAVVMSVLGWVRYRRSTSS